MFPLGKLSCLPAGRPEEELAQGPKRALG